MQPIELQDDLKAEVILVVCELDEIKLKGLHERGELIFYVVRVILSMAKSSTNNFFKKYKLTNEELHQEFTFVDIREDQPLQQTSYFELTDIEQRNEREKLEDLAIEKINTLDWYSSELLKLYIKLGNYRAVEKETNIPFASIYQNIKKSINKIRCELSLQV